jgi:hypothetical protein
MKVIFGLIYFSLVFCSNGQNQVPGEYISIIHLSTNVIDTLQLKLNCDKTFSSKSSGYSIFGRWRRKNPQRLILQVDSAIINSKPDLERRQIKLRMDNETLCWKKLNKRQLNKIKREIERSSGEKQLMLTNPPDNRKNNNCFKKLLNYTCT